MTLNPSYPTISLDSIANSAFFFSGRWTPDLKRNQSQQVLSLLITKFYFPCKGNIFKGSNPFHARIRASHAALATSLDLSREWVCKLIGRLQATGWIETHAPRLPNGKQEVTTFRPGGKLKRLLVMLLKSSQHNRVNNRLQEVPTSTISKQEVEKNLLFLRGLRESLGKKLGMKT